MPCLMPVWYKSFSIPFSKFQVKQIGRNTALCKFCILLVEIFLGDLLSVARINFWGVTLQTLLEYLHVKGYCRHLLATFFIYFLLLIPNGSVVFIANCYKYGMLSIG